MNNTGVLVGRILMAMIFILSGVYKFVDPAKTLALMRMDGIPAAQALLYVSAVIETAGGLMLLVGFRARPAALVLFLWLVPVTLMMHAIPGGQPNRVEVLKNLAIMGGLLVLAETRNLR